MPAQPDTLLAADRGAWSCWWARPRRSGSRTSRTIVYWAD